MQPPNSQNLRSTLGQFATGVTVLSCVGGNQTHGMTANSFCSVSLEPPLVQVAINQQARFSRWLKESQFYGINVLAENQQPLSLHFAGKPEKLPIPWFDQNFEHESKPYTVPLLKGCVAWMICTIETISVAGTHDLYLSRVQQVKTNPQKPLLFFGGQYTTVYS